MREGRRVVYSLLASMLVIGCMSGVPASKDDAGVRHLIYLHGRIVQEQQSARPLHPQHGHYELAEIVEAFRRRGFVVHSEIRPKATTVSEGADKVVADIRRLIDSGVPADRITVLGASMGASITFRVATRLRNPDVRFALLGPCASTNIPAVIAEERAYPQGRLLVVREESDIPSASCAPLKGDPAPAGLHVRELVIETGTAHGFLYRPMPEWVEPVVGWATAP